MTMTFSALSASRSSRRHVPDAEHILAKQTLEDMERLTAPRQLSFFDGINDLFRQPKTTGFGFATNLGIVQLRRCYKPVPPIIEQAWHALIPAIIELSWHQVNERWDMERSIRNALCRLRHAAHGNKIRDRFSPDNWLTALLIALGTLPLSTEALAQTRGMAGLSAQDRRKWVRSVTRLCRIAPFERAEAMICLEMLCTKTWYRRNREGDSDAQTADFLYRALQFTYWECGLPTSLDGLRTESMVFTDADYDSLRKQTYRQLYVLYEAGCLAELIEQITSGTRLLHTLRMTQRDYYLTRLRKDRRWSQPFEAHHAIIKAKYTVPDEPLKSAPEPKAKSGDSPNGKRRGRKPMPVTQVTEQAHAD